MAKLIILGSSNAIPDEKHENTHMVLSGRERTVLIDCVSNPMVRLPKAGLEFDNLTDIILTHFHPDHVSGVPLLLMCTWLQGRKRPLNIYGLGYTLDRVEKMMEFYDWATWPHFFPISFHRLPEAEMTPVIDCDEFRIFASPVHHLIPNIGLRVEFLETGKTMAYSCDTEPCREVVRLGSGADVLIHECSGATLGHTSAEQAGEIAQRAEAGALYLIHYPTGKNDPGKLVPDAKKMFNGPVALAEDFMTLEF
ncbi:MAG TPA: MBL fold metallo-hydrolase [Anaerolineales bacterium]